MISGSTKGQSKLLIGTLNVGGFVSRPEKCASIFEHIKNLDIITLQETHFSKFEQTLFFQQVF